MFKICIVYITIDNEVSPRPVQSLFLGSSAPQENNRARVDTLIRYQYVLDVQRSCSGSQTCSSLGNYT